jgi:hypothetical protein
MPARARSRETNEQHKTQVQRHGAQHGIVGRAEFSQCKMHKTNLFPGINVRTTLRAAIEIMSATRSACLRPVWAMHQLDTFRLTLEKL